MSAPLSLRERCLRVQLLVLDVDGVLTEGGIIQGNDGLELKHFHVRDGYGLKSWQRAGKHAAIITGRSAPLVEARAKEIGIATVVQGVLDKRAAFRRLLADMGLTPGQAAFVGDDLPDAPALAEAGLALAVADAVAEVRAAAHYITRRAGGCAAVRELVELILRCQGAWQESAETPAERSGNG